MGNSGSSERNDDALRIVRRDAVNLARSLHLLNRSNQQENSDKSEESDSDSGEKVSTEQILVQYDTPARRYQLLSAHVDESQNTILHLLAIHEICEGDGNREALNPVEVLDELVEPLLGSKVSSRNTVDKKTSKKFAHNQEVPSLVKVLRQCNAESRRPLHCAAARGSEQLVERLVVLDPLTLELTDARGLSPLVLALHARSSSCFEAMLKHTDAVDLNVERATGFKETLLMSVSWLLFAKWDDSFVPNDASSTLPKTESAGSSDESRERAQSEQQHNDETEQIFATEQSASALRTMLLLLLSREDIQPNACTGNQRKCVTPLHLAVRAQDTEVIKLLFKRGASPNVTDANMRTPFLDACASLNLDVIKLVLRNEQTVLSCRDARGDNVMHVLARHSCDVDKDVRPVVEWLLKQKRIKQDVVGHLTHRNRQGLLPSEIDGIASFLRDQYTGQISLSPANSEELVGFQICSDLHIEFYADDEEIPQFVEPAAKYLCLLGDIGVVGDGGVDTRYEGFLRKMARKFDKVFVVTGNHEYYKSSIERVDDAVGKACKKTQNLEFLNKRSVIVDGVRVIGCTLWSSIPEKYRDEVWMALNDFRQIMVDESRPLSPEIFAALHEEHAAFVRKELQEAAALNQRTIVLTHHAPLKDCGTSKASYYGGAANTCFCTDLSKDLGPPVRAWVYGHTHWGHDMTLAGTRVVSNPRGYKFNDTATPFDPRCVVFV